MPPSSPSLAAPAQASRTAGQYQFRKFGWGVAVTLVAATFLIGNFRLVTGEHSLLWDAEGFFAPAFTLVADHARAGRILLWNPWDSGGSPDYAEPELGATSPVMVAVGGIGGGTETAFRFYFLLIWLLGPIGLMFLARHLGLPPWAAAVVAVAWAFNGFYAGHASHVSSVYSLSALPWIVWRFDAALRTRRLLAAVESGALWGLSGLGGYPQLTILTGGFLFLWAVGWWLCPSAQGQTTSGTVSEKNRTSNLVLAALTVAVCAAVGIAVLSPAYAAFFREGGGYSDRVGPRSRLEATASMPMERGALATLSSPYLNTVNIYHTRLWPSTDGSYTNVYLGTVIPIFALLAFLASPRSSWRWWLAGMAMFSIACAVGNQLPVRGWLYDYVPPTRYFRNPGLFRCYAMLCVAVLAMLGLRDLMHSFPAQADTVWRKFCLAAAVTTGVAGLAYFGVLLQVPNRGSGFLRATCYLAITWGAALIIALAGWLRPSRRRLLPAVLVVLAVTDGLLSFSIERAATVSANYHARQVWDQLNAAHDPNLDLTANGLRRQLHFDAFPDSYPNNHNVVVKASTFINYDTMTNRFQEAMAGDAAVVSMLLGDERIWFSNKAVEVPPSDRAYEEFVRRTRELGAPVLVVHSHGQMLAISSAKIAAGEKSSDSGIGKLPAAQRVPAKLLSYTPNHLNFQVNCPHAGWLLVTDRWARGWSARVNGQPAEVFGGDFIFRALRVQAGENSIEFSYRPFGYPWLLILSWGTLALVGGSSVWRHRRWRVSLTAH